MTIVTVTGARPAWRLQDRLRRAREEAGLNQTQLAQEIGVNPATVSRYESGSLDVPLSILIAWAYRCSVDLDWLRDGDEVAPPKVAATAEPSGTLESGDYFHGTRASHTRLVFQCASPRRTRNVA